MRNFTLTFRCAHSGSSKIIQFESEDLEKAFYTLDDASPAEPAFLSENGRLLVRLERSDQGFWELRPPAPGTSPG